MRANAPSCCLAGVLVCRKSQHVDCSLALHCCTDFAATANYISSARLHCCTLLLPQQPKALVQKSSGSGSGSGRAQSGGNRNNNSSNGNNQDSAKRSTGGRGG
eukprot:1449-Heterococcus_DN1.PRE.1